MLQSVVSRCQGNCGAGLYKCEGPAGYPSKLSAYSHVRRHLRMFGHFFESKSRVAMHLIIAFALWHWSAVVLNTGFNPALFAKSTQLFREGTIDKTAKSHAATRTAMPLQ